MQLGNIASAIFLLDQKVDIEEFISRVKDISIGFSNLKQEQKMILRHWLSTTLSDELKSQLGNGIEDILIANKEEEMVMTSNISKTIKETFEKTRKEKAIEIARNLLDVLDDETISIKTGLSIEEVKELR
ncbi:MAG TPA: hypothetical protein VIK72_07445 [Clostridiaceae bacterium]